jgi:hypothetical protein
MRRRLLRSTDSLTTRVPTSDTRPFLLRTTKHSTRQNTPTNQTQDDRRIAVSKQEKVRAPKGRTPEIHRNYAQYAQPTHVKKGQERQNSRTLDYSSVGEPALGSGGGAPWRRRMWTFTRRAMWSAHDKTRLRQTEAAARLREASKGPGRRFPQNDLHPSDRAYLFMQP